MEINETVIISGKGGTGKTTLTASIIPFLKNPVLADCDVDAPDLHILLTPEIQTREDFIGTYKAEIDLEECSSCDLCRKLCRFGALSINNGRIEINRLKCEGCGVCEYVCSQEAIILKEAAVGEIFSSKTAYGPMHHARLIPGEETSGKLAAAVRAGARKTAEQIDSRQIIVDGSPGIGCAVISSITGASQAVIVTEPTLSGLHDLDRVYQLCRKLNISVTVVINKWDLSPELTEKIEIYCEKENLPVNLKIPFNEAIVKAVTAGKIPSLAEKIFFNKIGFFEFLETLFKEQV